MLTPKLYLRTSSYEPLIRARDEFCVVFVWEISARSTKVNPRNTSQIVEHKLVLFVTVTALWSLVTLLIKLIRILLKRKYIQDQNYAFLAVYVVRATQFCLKSFVPVTGLECSYRKIIWLPRYRSQKLRSR